MMPSFPSIRRSWSIVVIMVEVHRMAFNPGLCDEVFETQYILLPSSLDSSAFDHTSSTLCSGACTKGRRADLTERSNQHPDGIALSIPWLHFSPYTLGIVGKILWLLSLVRWFGQRFLRQFRSPVSKDEGKMAPLTLTCRVYSYVNIWCTNKMFHQ